MSTLFTARYWRFVLPFVILGLALLAAMLIRSNRPETVSVPTPERIILVDATRLMPSSYAVSVKSQGTVEPSLANTLVPEVAGTVVSLNEQFVVGGAFESGDILLQIDPRDYEIALTQAMANLAQAEARLAEQQALAERARDEWRALGRRGQPSSLTLREPQLAAARADRDAAQAQVQRAQLDLERTQIIAPYDGMVSERNIDLGQFVNRGSAVGRIHSIQAVDVKLPLTSRQLRHLDISSPQSRVILTASVAGKPINWQGSLVRVEGMDATTQQLTVVARVQSPLANASAPLRIGQFVDAEIEGNELAGVFVIPRSALREQREVLLIDTSARIQRRQVSVAWSDDALVAIDQGLDAGEILVTTPLSTVADGTPVRANIDGAAPVPMRGARPANANSSQPRGS